jgi:hypothetical protein
MVRLMALKSHTVDGSRRYRIGEAYEVSDSAARVLIAFGLARRTDPVDAEPPRKKNEYRRRDMKAEK